MAQRPAAVAVVVTWNRRDLLTKSLTAVLAQTSPPETVVVVDNASDDGTSQMVAERFPAVDLVTAARNTGGAGGFAVGLARALRRPGDAVWLMDDDTVPEPGALAALLDARARYPGRTPALVASRVVWTDGRDHPMNTPRRRPFAGADAAGRAAGVGCIPIRSASFVSILVDAARARSVGLPVADYFLWNDDFEYTTRLLRGAVGLYCPASVAVHRTEKFGASDADPGGRLYYEVRNKVWLFTRSRSLSPVEKVVYGGSTVRRWVRTVARSAPRTAALRQVGRGLVGGLRRPPRRTEDVVAEILGAQAVDEATAATEDRRG
ncbi:MAG TPA: glycosyltransferase [Nocardioidaceae bacterium]|nr:glycosyltransferase [Nocardioidaceae bacterium]